MGSWEELSSDMTWRTASKTILHNIFWFLYGYEIIHAILVPKLKH